MAGNQIPQGQDTGPLNADTGNPLPTVDTSSITNLLPVIPGTTTGNVQTPGPLDPNAPRSLSALQTKYAQGSYFQQLSSQYSQPVIKALQAYDQSRVQQGQAPLTEDQTRKALQTAQTGIAATPAPDKSMLDLPGNAWDDLSNIVTSIPKLPKAIYDEVTHVGDIPKAISEASNPIAGLANAPLIRMIPGAFTIGNIASGNPGELLRHPLFTALDLLPGVEKIAEHSAVATAARESADLLDKGGLSLPTREARIIRKQAARPIATWLTNYLKDDGGIARNAAGQLMDKLADTKLISPLRRVFGQEARDSMFIVNDSFQHIPGIANGTIDPVTQLDKLYSEASKYRTMLNDIDPELIKNIQPLSTRWKMGDFTGMTDNELLAAERTRQLQDKIGIWGTDEGVLSRFDGETYDVKTGVKLLNKDKEVALSAVKNAERNAQVTGLTAARDATFDTIDTILSPTLTHEPTRLGLTKVKSGMRNGDWKTVTEGLDQLKRAPDGVIPDTFIQSVRDLRDQSRKFDRDYAKFTDRHHSIRVRQMERLRQQSIPARFIPLASENARKALLAKLIPVGDAAAANEVITLANQGRWMEIPGMTEKMFHQTTAEAARQWQALRDQATAAGNEGPIFMHSVTPNKATQAVHPMVNVVPATPSSLRARMLDMAPAVQDMSVGINHQMLEFMSQQQAEVAIKQLMDGYGRSESSLRAEYGPIAERRLQSNKALDMEGHMQNAINQHWTKFNPETAGYNWGSPYLKGLSKDQMWIPKDLATNLKELVKPKQVLGGVLDPLTSMFRIATTSLSLRTQIYNIIGGDVALELARPGASFRSMGQALDAIHNPELMPDALKRIVGQQKHTLMDLDKESLGVLNEGVFGHMKGTMLKRFWDAEQEAKVPGTSLAHRYGGKFKNLVQKSYDLNGWFDDLYRTTAFYDTYNEAIRKGYTTKAAEDTAVATTRRVLNDWMGMTPTERTAIKSIIPFYGYMGHAVRFVLRYPLDHPLRVEVMSKLAETELEDQGALPSRFLSQLFFGSPGPQGERNAINLDPLNPFGGVANFMTVSGFLGQTNPAISTLLEMAGLDSSGNAQLYPSLRYDPATGRLAADTGNPLEKLLYNTIPQANLLTSILGVNTQYRDMVKRDPAAALRFLASSATIPVPYRSIQVNQEIMKAELAREKATSSVLNEALKTGDWSEALLYPSLREYLSAMDQLPTGSLDAFQPVTSEQTSAIVQGLPTQGIYSGTTPLNQQVQAQMQLVSSSTGQPSPGQFAPGGSIAADNTGGV